MHRYRYYKSSKSATVYWWIGILFAASGIGNVMGRMPLFGLGTIVIAFFFGILAENDVEEKTMRHWKQGLDEDGIRANLSEAVQAYNRNPCRRSVNYIRRLNPEAADYILRNAGKKKGKGEKTYGIQ